jgi:hypothetical protein
LAEKRSALYVYCSVSFYLGVIVTRTGANPTTLEFTITSRCRKQDRFFSKKKKLFLFLKRSVVIFYSTALAL